MLSHVPSQAWTYAASAMVTSTSTPGSMLMEVICFTISEGECRSITRLWILIWNLSQVLEHFLQRLHVPGGQSDPDPVDGRLLLNSLSILVCSHDFGRVSDWSTGHQR